MRSTTLFVLSTFLLLNSCQFFNSEDSSQKVNAVLGDQSFIWKYGVRPNEETPEKVRINTHLEYVEYLLRKKGDEHLNIKQKENRNKILDHLHAYWKKAAFPENLDHPEERKPCFIDKNGNICAVGYLLEKTEDRQLAEAINDQFKYSLIKDMDDPKIEEWANENGLNLEECAMIQPTYGPLVYVENNYISTEYAIGSAMLSASNIAFSTIGLIQLPDATRNSAVPIIGLATGTAQVAMGILGFEDTIGEDSNFSLSNTQTVNNSKRTLSMVNVGIGSASMIFNFYSLISKKRYKPKSTSWNIYGLPNPQGDPGLAFSVKRQLRPKSYVRP